jgi:hypothetical protein
VPEVDRDITFHFTRLIVLWQNTYRLPPLQRIRAFLLGHLPRILIVANRKYIKLSWFLKCGPTQLCMLIDFLDALQTQFQ